MRANAWWTALVALGVGACGDVVQPETDGGARDGGPPPETDMFVGLADRVQVSGKVVVGFRNTPAPRVKVVAFCDDRAVETLTDDEGRYDLTVDIRQQCNRFAVEFTKEAFLPVLKTIPLNPLPADELTLDVALAELSELICGESVCIAENDRRIWMRANPVARGFIGAFSGPQSLPFAGGEFRDTEGTVLFVPAFRYADLRDGDGRVLDELPGGNTCVGIDFEARSQLADVDEAREGIQMKVYVLDQQSGRWRKISDDGYVAIADGLTPEGFEILRDAEQRELGDIRSGLLTNNVYACGPRPGSGWLAFGVPIARTGCLRVEVADPCGRPVPYAAFKVIGHDQAFHAETWTDADGDACITTAPSENIAEDLNHNRAGGEKFLFDVSVSARGIPYPLDATQMPEANGNCLDPDTCIPFRVKTLDTTGDGCP